MWITDEHRRRFQCDGYAVVPGLFTADEVAGYRDHFMRLRGQGAFPGDLVGIDPASNDPLKQYPRMIHMHRWDDLSLRWMLDARLGECMTGLLGLEPFAVQTMLYFKPPGARGQALHQDQYYLRVSPGTCIASWLALDDCDEANGCLEVVPGSHQWPLLCTEQADTTESFTDVTVPIPEGTEVRRVVMRAGDVMFFHGSLVHGSHPNRTVDRFRRSLIGHYIQGDAEQVARFYHPALRFDGSLVELESSPDGGACGVWVERDGSPVIEVTGTMGKRIKISE